MSSVSRSYSQRNNNITQIIPEFVSITPTAGGPLDISGAYVYVLSLPNVPVTGGVFYVDLSGNDLSGNPISGAGEITANGNQANIVLFTVNQPTNPVYYPGLEYTIFFRNVPSDLSGGGPPLFTVGMVSQYFIEEEGDAIPFILSPPIPILLTAPTNAQSVTYKCDGADFNVTGSGPAGWLGIGAFGYLLAQA